MALANHGRSLTGSPPEPHASLSPVQLISACNPHPHYGMNAYTGRGAPEIDLLEAMPGKRPLPPSKVGIPYFSSSLQMSPGVEMNRPGNGGVPMPGQWYDDLEYGSNSSQNIWFFGSRNTKKNERQSYQVTLKNASPVFVSDRLGAPAERRD